MVCHHCDGTPFALPLAMSSKLIAFACATLVASSCAATPTQPDSTVFPVTLSLKAGQTSAAGGLGVTFVGVTNDWRCPINALCISSGDAYLKFVLAANNDLADYQLQVEHPDYRRTTYRGYTLEVQSLEPYPYTVNPIKPEDYKVTVKVTR